VNDAGDAPTTARPLTVPSVPGLDRVHASGPCQSCGVPHARMWGTREGAARLCPTCATLHGLGCP